MIIIEHNKKKKNNNIPIIAKNENNLINSNFGTDIPIESITPLLFLFGIFFVINVFSEKEKKPIKIPYLEQYGKDNIEDKYKNKLEHGELNQLIQISKSIDESKPYKYFDWIIKEFLKNKKIPDIYEKIREYVSSFNHYVNKNIIHSSDSDIYRYNLNELINIVEKARKYISKTSIKKKKKYGEGLIEDKDFKVIFENDNYYVIAPLTYEASCFYGKTTRWCIAMHNEPMHWKNYEKLGIKFYFVINNNEKSSKYGYAVYAVAVYPHLKNQKPLIEVYDENDNLIPAIKFEDIIK